MYRNHFSKKSSNFKTVKAKAAAPGGSIKPSVTKVGKVTHGPKTHANSINPSMIKSVNYEKNDDNNSYVIIVDLYDNIEGKPLDYVKKTDEADSSVANGFDNTLLLPIYYPAANAPNNDTSAKPHIDELQNMYQWLIMSKDLETTDPDSTETNPTTYCLRLHADTRTIIKEPVNNKINVDLSVIPIAMKKDVADEDGNYSGETYSVEKFINGQSITIKYPVVWLGFYGGIDQNGKAIDPKFLRCYLENFRAEELYIASGSKNDGIYTPAHVTNELPEVEITTGDNFSYYPEHATFVNCKKDGLFIEDIDATEVAGACIPGYEIYPEMIQQDKQDAGGMEIKSRPLQYSGLEDLTYIEEITGTESDIEATKLAVFKITNNDKDKDLDVSIRSYADSDFKIAKPRIAFAYAYTDNNVDWKNPNNHAEGGVLKEATSQAICAKIKRIKGFHIKGPIDVYQIVNENRTEVSCKLRYLNALELEDCLLEDEIKPFSEAAIEYFWLYNVILTACDNQMKYYKAVNDKGIQIIGEEKEGQMVGENGDGIRKIFRKEQSYGTAGYNPTNVNMWFDTLDDLYGWLMQKHRVSLGGNIQAPEIVLPGTETIAIGTYKMQLYVQETRALYYHPGTPSKLDWNSTDGKLVTLIYKVTKEIENSTGKYDTVQFHLCWKVNQEEESDYTTVTGDNTEYWCDTYYGLIGSDYFGELSEIFWKINKVESILEPKTEATKVTSVITADAENSKTLNPSQMTKYLTKLKKILERMPINTKYVCEAAGLLAKYVTFENVRMPSIHLETSGDSSVYEGLDRNHPTSCSEANQTAVNEGIFDGEVVDGIAKINNNFITYKFKVQEGNVEGDYFWASEPNEDYPHTSLVSDITSAYEVLNWTCWGTASNPSVEPDNGSNAENVEQELYVATKLILDSGIKYYGQSAPITKNGITVEMIDAAELEIYEEEAIYQVHYANVENNVVVGLSINGSTQVGKATTEPFINTFLTEINTDLVEYLNLDSAKSQGYTLNEFVAYVKPTVTDKVTVADRNKLIEYSQMLNTIQGQRDFIQKKGDDKTNFLLKFQQTSKGTMFEVMKAEGDNYALEEDVYGYYISQGYGYSLPTTTDNIIKVPKGRKEMRMRGSKGAAPTVNSDNKVVGRFRITRMPRYYEQEPLCWRNDNYFSNQIYTLNADNLNTIIDPEFEAREKTIFTKDGNDKVKEQEMIGFYTVSVTETDQ